MDVDTRMSKVKGLVPSLPVRSQKGERQGRGLTPYFSFTGISLLDRNERVDLFWLLVLEGFSPSWEGRPRGVAQLLAAGGVVEAIHITVDWERGRGLRYSSLYHAAHTYYH